MSHTGYRGKALEFLVNNKIEIGNQVKIYSDEIYSGIIMPRYEHSDEDHVVLKLKSGYNVGIDLHKIKKIDVESTTTLKKEDTFVVKSNPKLPKILLLSTGGTIASRIDYRTGAVRPALTAEELNASVPELASIANIDTEVLFSEYSENLLPEHWIKIAEKLDSYTNSDYHGIIVAHGTDTMQYTASALAYSLSGYPKPVALVGSQRSSDRPSSDAALNLIAATRFLTNVEHNGFFVIMHNSSSDDEIACHWATRVRKSHTSKRDAFKTIGGLPAYIITTEKIEKNELFVTIKKEYSKRIGFDPRVLLIKYYPGLNPSIIEHAISTGCRGIIIEGTGLGHVGKTMYQSIEKAKEKDLFIGMTSQCIDGMVRMTVYDSGRDLLNLGVIPLKDMLPETALVKLMWALAHSKDSKEVTKLMNENIALEFSD